MTDQDIFEQGKAALASKDFGKAISLLRPLAEAATPRPAIIFYARAEYENGNPEGCEPWLTDFLERQPRHPGALLLRAKLLVDNGKLSEAKAALEIGLEMQPGHVGSVHLLNTVNAKSVEKDALKHIAVIDADCTKTRSKNPAKAVRVAAEELAKLSYGNEWNNDPVQAKIAYFVNASDIEQALRNYDAHLIEVSCELDYITWPKRIQNHVRGKSVIDVGCGFGGYGMGFLVAGATKYVGLDPVMNLDSTRAKNKRIRKWADMGITPREIEKIHPAISLFQGTSEDLDFDEKFDTIALHNVTEHLIQLDLVFAGLVPMCKPETEIVFLHHNYYCWNGHHFAPNQPKQLDMENEKHLEVYDWRHIELVDSLPDNHYFKTHLNRVTLAEIRATTEKHFKIDVWDELPSNKATLERLTPDVIKKVQAYRPEITEKDLRTNVVYCVARPK